LELYFLTEQEDVERKKQKQAERMTNFMNKYKATLESEKLKQSTVAPVSKYEEKYIFAPEDFKYENKHYKYIKYIKNNNQVSKVCKLIIFVHKFFLIIFIDFTYSTLFSNQPKTNGMKKWIMKLLQQTKYLILLGTKTALLLHCNLWVTDYWIGFQ